MTTTIATLAEDVREMSGIGDGPSKLAKAARGVIMAINEVIPATGINVKSEYFTINDHMVVKLPGGVTAVNKVGVVDEYAKIRVMLQDLSIRRTFDASDCDTGSTTTTVTPESSQGVWIPFLNCDKGELYGYANDQSPNGSYRFNENAMRIEFASGYDAYVGAQVLVEYRHAVDQSITMKIPSDLQNVIINIAISNVLAAMKPGVADEFRKTAAMQFRAYKTQKQPANPDQLAAALRGPAKPGPQY